MGKAGVLRTITITVFIVAARAAAAPDYWDSRLNLICGLFLQDVSAGVPEGQGYWRLTRAEFQDESQSGFNHHIYYKALDVDGNPIENQKTWTSWNYTSETSSAWQLTKGAVDGYWGNFAMYANCPPGACNWPYNAWIDTAGSPHGYVGPSDKLYGMGMHNPNGTGCGAHVNFRLTWRWTIKSGPPAPAISRAPSSFNRTITAGGTLANDSFTVSNSGGGTLNYSVDDNAAWLNATPSSGSTTGPANSHQVVYSVSGLTAGTYNATITITAGGATNSPQTISVTLTVNPPPLPRISRSPISITRRVMQGQLLSTDTFTVWNSGAGTLNYSIAESLGWLDVLPASGSSTGASNTHTISYNTAGLNVGTHTGSISISSASADNSPQSISMALIVDPLVIPGDMDGDFDVDQSDFGMLQACLTGDGLPQDDPACARAKMDNDIDVDVIDVMRFLNCFTGPGIQGNPACNP